MLDIKKLNKEFTKVLNSISDEEFYAWNAAYDKKKALEDAKWERLTVEERYDQIFASNCGMALDIALSNGSLDGAPKKSAAKPKLNGAPQSAPKAKDIPIKKMNAKASQPRSSDGRFASAKKTTNRAAAFA